jgi:hypothetical protein
MAVAEAGYPGAIGIDGDLLDLEVPPDVIYRAWALATEQTHVPFADFVSACLENGGAWLRYFDRWGIDPKDSDASARTGRGAT